MKRILKFFLTISIIALFAGCGGGGESSTDSQTTSNDGLKVHMSSVEDVVTIPKGSSIEIDSGAMTGNIKSRNLSLNGQPLGSNQIYTLSALPPGKYTIVLTIIDENNNATTKQFTLIVSNSNVITPIIMSVTPTNNQKAVQVDSSIAVIFSENMDQSSLIKPNISLKKGNVDVPFTLTYPNATEVSIQPSANLEFDTVYTFTLNTNIKSASGVSLKDVNITTFTTKPQNDTTPPTILSISPKDASLKILPSADIVVEFDEAIDPNSLTNAITLTNTKTNTAIGYKWVLNGSTLTIKPGNPYKPFEYDTKYELKLKTNIQDMSGNALASEETSYFTTTTAPDTTPPTVVSTNPTDNATSVPIGVTIKASFSEAMERASLTKANILLKDNLNNPVDFLLHVDSNDKDITIVPKANLKYNTKYTFTITSSVQDISSNHLASDKVVTFTTEKLVDNIPPQVVSTTPKNSDKNIPLTSAIKVEFSESTMDVSTINSSNITLTQNGINVPFSISNLVDKNITITPNSLFAYDKSVTLTITAGVTDMAGNPLQIAYTTTFDTEPKPTTITANILPGFNAKGVQLDENVTIIFTKEVKSTSLNTSNIIIQELGTTKPLAYKMVLHKDNKKVSIKPLKPFKFNTKYEVVLQNVTDMDSVAINPNPTSSLFTTIPKPVSAVLRSGQIVSHVSFDDGFYQVGKARSYVKTSANVVHDNATGLDWQDSNDNKIISKTWVEAKKYCDTLVTPESSNWRLPSRYELYSIVDFGRKNPTLDNKFKFIVNNGAKYWTDDSDIKNTNYAWFVNFKNGVSYKSDTKDTSNYVRCVKGTPYKNDNTLTISAKTVKDNTARLQWQDDVDNTTLTLNWHKSIDYCENLKLGGYEDWRLPNVNELRSIVDLKRGSQSIKQGFAHVGSKWYWTSTTTEADTSEAYDIQFKDGETNIYSKINNAYVRCVRSL